MPDLKNSSRAREQQLLPLIHQSATPVRRRPDSDLKQCCNENVEQCRVQQELGSVVVKETCSGDPEPQHGSPALTAYHHLHADYSIKSSGAEHALASLQSVIQQRTLSALRILQHAVKEETSATLPTVAMAAAVPTFSWTYKAGQRRQQPHQLCPRVHIYCATAQGHPDAGHAPQ
ncbi:unnamed protein product [Pleuronectes platessa]|uniref:Uncharacterized protein n=1 Tax=Pleuronectes platessa TaxID=8262 RepID=A0A9N7TUW3_PLEPL|nr:unnamed protein product [Pleuronectes platessa]